MKLINDHELKRLLLQNPKTPFSQYARAYQEKLKEADSEAHFDLDDLSFDDAPRCVFNAYHMVHGHGGIVGVDCQILYVDKGDEMPFKADLAIATNVPGFWTIHESVLVYAMEPVVESAADGIIHLADANYAQEIQAISLTAGKQEQ